MTNPYFDGSANEKCPGLSKILKLLGGLYLYSGPNNITCIYYLTHLRIQLHFTSNGDYREEQIQTMASTSGEPMAYDSFQRFDVCPGVYPPQ